MKKAYIKDAIILIFIMIVIFFSCSKESPAVTQEETEINVQYRIKQVDKDGTVTYSPVINIKETK